MTSISRARETVSGMWRAKVPLYTVELDDGRAWEFYECGVVRFRDMDYEEWAPIWEYDE